MDNKQHLIALEYIRLSNGIYSTTEDSDKNKTPQAIDGWEYADIDSDDLLSDDDTGYFGAVYFRKVLDENGNPALDEFGNEVREYALVSQGSNPEFDDWLGNSAIIGGNMLGISNSLPPQLDSLLKFAAAAVAEIPDINSANEFTFAGHSLGGILSKMVGIHLGSENIWAVNSGALDDDLLLSLAKYQVMKDNFPDRHFMFNDQVMSRLIDNWVSKYSAAYEDIKNRDYSEIINQVNADSDPISSSTRKHASGFLGTEYVLEIGELVKAFVYRDFSMEDSVFKRLGYVKDYLILSHSASVLLDFLDDGEVDFPKHLEALQDDTDFEVDFYGDQMVLVLNPGLFFSDPDGLALDVASLMSGDLGHEEVTNIVLKIEDDIFHRSLSYSVDGDTLEKTVSDGVEAYVIQEGDTLGKISGRIGVLEGVG